MMRILLLLLLALLACAPPPSPFPSPATPEATLRTGVDALRAGNLEVAGRHLEAARANLPLLADHARAHLARVEERRGRLSDAARHWHAILNTPNDSVWQGPAALALARQAIDSGDAAAARDLVARARNRSLLHPERASALWIEARIERQAGSASEARRLRDRVRKLYAGLPEGREAATEAWAARTESLVSLRRAKAEIHRWIFALRADRAVMLAREARARLPAAGDQAPLAWLEAEGLRIAGNLDGAESTLREIRLRYPESHEAAEALYRLAVNAWNRDADTPARKLLAEYVRRYPDGPHVAECLYATAQIHFAAARHGEAAIGFAKMLRAYPKSPLGGEARWQIGWTLYRSGRFDKAEAAFERAARSSEWRMSALYWRARSRQRQGLDATAHYAALIRRSPDDYYAWMAGRRIGQSIVVPTAKPSAAFGKLPADRGNVHLRRMNTLVTIGLRDLARRELESVSGVLPVRERLDAWVAVGGYREALRRAYNESRCQPLHPLAAYCYPHAFPTIVDRESRRHAIDPWLLLSLIRQESLFDPEALSRANARGLMQLLPKTAKETAQALGWAGFTVSSLFIPEYNIALGVAHLSKLARKFEGSVVRMLAAYNAGVRAVTKWDQRFPGAEDDEFVDSISYRETRNYVRKVLRDRLIYESMYQDINRTGHGTAG